MIAGATRIVSSTSRRSSMKRKRETGLATVSAITAIGSSSVRIRPIAVLVEMAQLAVLHGKGMPLTGTNAFLVDVSRGQLCRDGLLCLEAIDDAVDDSFGTQRFRTIDTE